MKKLILFFLLLAGVAYGQTPNATNTKFTNGLAVPNGVSQKPTSGLTAGALSYVTGAGLYVYNGSSWELLGLSSGGVTSFNGRTGIVTPAIGDYSSFYVPLTRSLTINGATQTLAADRTWTITANTPNSLTNGYGLTGGVFDGSAARTWVADTSSVAGLVSKLRLAANLTGYVKKATTITINGVTQDLSDSRTYSVGTLTSITPGYGLTPQTPITSSGGFGVDTLVLDTVYAKIGSIPTQYWSRTGSTLSPSTAQDIISYSTNASLATGLQVTSSGIAGVGIKGIASGSAGIGVWGNATAGTAGYFDNASDLNATLNLVNTGTAGITNFSNTAGIQSSILNNGGYNWTGATPTTLAGFDGSKNLISISEGYGLIRNSTSVRVDTSSVGLQTVANFFPKGDTRWAKSVAVQDSLTKKANRTFDNVASGAIANVKLANSTISGVALGSNLNSLTLGNGLTGTSYNGSSAITARADTAVVQTVSNFFPKGDTRYQRTSERTTVGNSFYTLTNPSAITFPRINANNTVSALSASDFRTAIGAGTGGGSVTSVAATVPTGLTVSGSPITSSGTLAFGLQSGYSIPTTAKQGQWDTAYGWGNPSGVYLPLTGGTLTGALNGTTATFSGQLIGGALALSSLVGSGNVIAYATNSGTIGKMAIGSGLSFSGGILSATGGSAGTVTGSGTSGNLAKWNSASDIGNSIASETGTTLNVAGQGRFTGWYSGGGTGIGAEIGVVGGVPTIIGYNRTSPDYEPLSIQGSSLTFVGAAAFSSSVTATSFTGAGTGLTGTASGLNIGGNAATATKLATARTINGTSFDGTSNISIGTTVGQAFIGLTNPSAITFPRINANNSVSALSASDFRTAIGAGTSSTTGTVTSVGAGNGMNFTTITGSGSVTLGTPSSITSSSTNSVSTTSHTHAITSLPSATTATTQTAGDNSTKIATTAYVDKFNLASGTYTPTLTNELNTSAAANNGVAHYIRVGDQVTVYGSVSFSTTTGGNTTSIIGISLPIASNFTTGADAVGNGNAPGAAQSLSSNAVVYADHITDTAYLGFYAISATGSGNLSYSFIYTVK